MSRQLTVPAPTSLVSPCPGDEQRGASLSRRLVELVIDLGVEHAFGLVGGAIAPFADELGKSGIRTLAFRHEAGAAFAAVEASLATGRPVLLYVTTGPGLLNALNGIVAARWEGARVIVVSGATAMGKAGRGAVQETSPYTLGNPALLSDRLFDLAVTVTAPEMLQQAGRRLAERLMRPGPTLAHLALPVGAQSAPGGQRVTLPAQLSRNPSSTEVGVIANLLTDGNAILWLGFGARRAVAEVRALAERTGALVMCTPRAKGVFPEEHPQFIGVTGLAGHENIERVLAARPATYALVLGTRLGEASTMWDERLIPDRGLLHVDIDPTAFGAAFPAHPCVGIQAEIGELLRGVLFELDDGSPRPAPSSVRLARPPRMSPRGEGPVRPFFLMQAIQERVVEGSAAPVLAESGTSFTWTTHYLRFSSPRYRMSGGWGSMGHMTCGVVGAALAGRSKAVAVVGDGAMLMQQEVSTAVAYRVPAVWIVLNDGAYGITDKGMRAQGFEPLQTRLPLTDFAAGARSLGADGVVVEREDEVEAALEQAMQAEGPFVVDVRVDGEEPPPIMRRIRSLDLMGHAEKP